MDNLPLVLDGHPNLPSPCQSLSTHLAIVHPFTHSTNPTHTRQPPSRCLNSLNLLVVCGGYTRSTSSHQHPPATHCSRGASFSLAHSKTRPYLSLEGGPATCDCRPRLSEKSPIVYTFARYSSTASRHGKAHFHRRATLQDDFHIDSISAPRADLSNHGPFCHTLHCQQSTILSAGPDHLASHRP